MRKQMIYASLVLALWPITNAVAADRSELTEDEVRAKIQELYDSYNNRDVEAIVSSRFGFEPGFGFRTFTPRGVEVVSNDQLRAGLTRGFEFWEIYKVEIDSLNVSIHKDVAVVWGTHTETVKANGNSPEVISVRFSQTLLRDDKGDLISVHSHRDIQKFGANGRYVPNDA